MAEKKNWFERLMDRFRGDKLVLIIVMCLMMISALCIFSSTSQLSEVLKGSVTRTEVLFNHFKTIAMGLAAIAFVYFCMGPKSLKFCGRIGFITSLFLLLWLGLRISAGPIRAAAINRAYRVIAIGSFQFHVFEFVKVAMVMYLAWAMETYKEGRFILLEWIASLSSRLEFLNNDWWKKFVCIYVPMGLVFILVAMGSVTSSLFIGLIMFLTIVIGGLKVRDIIIPGLIIMALAGGAFMTYKATDGKIFHRLATAESRLESFSGKVDDFLQTKPKSQEYYKALGKIEQQYGSRIAIMQGGLLGKGAGGSTQRYKVSVMYEDFMFSFIVEEYGLIGAIIIMILFSSLISRGSFIARNCSGSFEKIAVAGLVLLISGQAYLHMFVNAGIFPMTGQTLPLISHGRFAFLMFSLAFGVILCISKGATKKMAAEARKAGSLIDELSEVQAGLNDLDEMEDNLN